MAKQQQHTIQQRQAVMSNPYHAGFTGDDGRDPFGGAVKPQKQQAKPIQSEAEALKLLTDMMDKRVKR